MTNKAKFKDMFMYLMLVVVGAALFISAQSIQVGATLGKGGDFMPKLCTTLWLILSVWIFISEYRKAEIYEPMKSVKGLLISIVILFLYIGLLQVLGFVIMSAIYLFIQMFLFLPTERRNKKQYIKLAIISVIAPFLVNWLFVNVFSLILPNGIF